jgi:hypothetical protein
MKRDMDLIRLLLLRSEGDATAESECNSYAVPVVSYHVQLMIDAGLIEGTALRDPDGTFSRSVVSRLTWAGHDFIESTRDNTVWKKAKEHVLKPGASWTFDLLKDWVKQEIKGKIGLP